MRCRVRKKSCLHCSAVNVQISSRLPSEMCSRQRFFCFFFLLLASEPANKRPSCSVSAGTSRRGQASTFPRRTPLVPFFCFFPLKKRKDGIAKFATTCSCGRFLSVTGAQRLHDNCLPIRRERVRVPHNGQNSAIPSSGSPHGLSAAAERRSFRSSASKEEADLESRTETLARIKSV